MGRVGAASIVIDNVVKMYGLHPRKGSIAIGSDADLVIWDTERSRTIRNADLHHNVDYTPYEGTEINAWPAMTFSRGCIIYCEGDYLGQAGMGKFLSCSRPTPARPKPRWSDTE